MRLVPHPQLAFTVVISDNKAVVLGDLGAASARVHGGLWLEATTEPHEIVTDLAYTILHRKVIDQHPEVADLKVGDFRMIMEILAAAEELNRRVTRGYVLDQEFAGLLQRIEPLTKQVPSWREVTIAAARIAESAGNVVAASRHHARAAAIGKQKSNGTAELEVVASQEAFRQTMEGFIKLMGLEGPHPRVVFEEIGYGAFFLWDNERGIQVVNTARMATPGLPELVALSGWFMERNYARCIGNGVQSFGVESLLKPNFWNDFRHGTDTYLIESAPQFKEVAKDEEMNRAGIVGGSYS
jgi:hypothetical protein